MESVPYRQIKQRAEQYNNTLLATDPRFQRSVGLFHRDGSSFIFTKAFLMKKDGWLIVFAEHHGVHVYDADDVIYEQYHVENADAHILEELP